MTREEWLKARENGIGASEIAWLMRGNRYGNAEKLYLLKKHLIEPEAGSPWQRWGERVQSVILESLREDYGWAISEVGFELFRHAEHEWMTATPDAICCADVGQHLGKNDFLIEVKNSRKGDDWGPSYSNIIPPDYLWQCQQQIEVMRSAGAPEFQPEFVLLVVLLYGSHRREYVIRRDPDLVADLIETGGAFWRDHIIAGVPPEPDYSHPTSLPTTKRRFNALDGTIDQLEGPELDEAAALVAEHKKAEAEAKAALQRKDAARDQLLRKMENRNIVLVPGVATLKRSAVHKEPYVVGEQNYIDFRILKP